MYLNDPGHMTRMTSTPMFDKYSLKFFFYNQKLLGYMYYQIC